MSDKKRTVVWRPQEQPTWAVVIDASEYWADFWLVEAGQWSSDDNGATYNIAEFIELNSERRTTRDPVEAIELKDPVKVHGFLKWDGCNECTFDDHMCAGAASVKRLCEAWVWAFEECEKAMNAQRGRG